MAPTGNPTHHGMDGMGAVAIREAYSALVAASDGRGSGLVSASVPRPGLPQGTAARPPRAWQRHGKDPMNLVWGPSSDQEVRCALCGDAGMQGA